MIINYTGITEKEEELVNNALLIEYNIFQKVISNKDRFDFTISVSKDFSDNRYFISLVSRKADNPNQMADVIFRVIAKDLPVAIEEWNKHIGDKETVKSIDRVINKLGYEPFPCFNVA